MANGAMQIVPLHRREPGHPQAQACAACEVRGSALFGVLDDGGLARIHTRIASLEIAPDRPVYARGEAIACTPVQLCRIPRHLVDHLASAQGSLPRREKIARC